MKILFSMLLIYSASCFAFESFVGSDEEHFKTIDVRIRKTLEVQAKDAARESVAFKKMLESEKSSSNQSRLDMLTKKLEFADFIKFFNSSSQIKGLKKEHSRAGSLGCYSEEATCTVVIAGHGSKDYQYSDNDCE